MGGRRVHVGGGDPFGWWGRAFREGGPRVRRGDVKWALLELLSERPRHGYDLIKELEARYGGLYRPSPGAVYPTLQMLEDGGYVTSEAVDGKRIYTITDAGRALLDEHRRERSAEREDDDDHPFGFEFPADEAFELKRAAFELGAAVMQVVASGDSLRMKKATDVLDRARKDVFRILGDLP
jgi:DNA-binding PadR family transcriptional regulator